MARNVMKHTPCIKKKLVDFCISIFTAETTGYMWKIGWLITLRASWQLSPFAIRLPRSLFVVDDDEGDGVGNGEQA